MRLVADTVVHEQAPCACAHLLVEVFQLAPWELEECNLWQDDVPAAVVDVAEKRVEAVDGVEGHLAFILQGLCVMLFNCSHQPHLDGVEGFCE